MWTREGWPREDDQDGGSKGEENWRQSNVSNSEIEPNNNMTNAGLNSEIHGLVVAQFANQSSSSFAMYFSAASVPLSEVSIGVLRLKSNSLVGVGNRLCIGREARGQLGPKWA